MSGIDRRIVFILIFLCILFVNLNLQKTNASGPIYIRADGTVEPIGAPIQRNGDVYILTDNVTSQADGIIIETSNITFDGSGYTMQGGAGGNGFYLHGISNVTIRNARTEGFNYGIYLESTSRNVISRNDIKGSTYDGIGLYDATNNTVSSNSIGENDWSGVGLYFSMGNNITSNYISNNYYAMNCFSSQENWIFHNNFVANTNQTSSDGLPNAWDNGYPSGGNYWGDYSGNDIYAGPFQNETGSDGIGDTPYVIDENNQDLFPLMHPWTNILITNMTPSKTIAGRGFTVRVSVTVHNQGWSSLTTNVTASDNTTVIGTVNDVVVESHDSSNVTFIWNTIGLNYGNDTLTAYAQPVSGETLFADNSLTSWVIVTIPGDINGDSTVNIIDAIVMGNSFLATPDQPPPYWNPNADINSDNVVNILDAIVMGIHFLEHYS